MLNLMHETYEHIYNEMKPIVNRHLICEGRKLQAFKIVARDTLSLRILAIDDKICLWNLSFIFSDADWNAHPIQSAARLQDCRELLQYSPNTPSTKWMSEIQRTKSAINFFENALDFHQEN